MYVVYLYDNPNKQNGTLIHSPDTRPLKISSGDVAHGINVVDSFTAQLNMENPGYNKIVPRKTWVEVRDVRNNKVEFYGYALRESYNMDADGRYSKDVTFVDGLNLLSETVQFYGEYHDTTPRDFMQIMIDNHNSQIEAHKRFKLGRVEVTNTTDNVYRYLSQEDNTLDSIFDKLVDRLGGEIRARKEDDGWYLDWVEEFSEVKPDTPISVGKNLQSASRELNGEDIITRFMIYGAEIEKEDADIDDDAAYAAKERITIANVNNGRPYIDDVDGIRQFGIIVGHVTFSDVNTESILLQRGRDYVQSYKQMIDSNSVTAFDLSLINQTMDAYEVGNYHPLNNPGFTEPYNVRIVEKKINIVEPHRSTLTIGDRKYTSSQYQAESRRTQKRVEELQQDLINERRQAGRVRRDLINQTNEMKVIIENMDTSKIPSIEQGLNDINDLLQDLEEDINSIPVYNLATPNNEGLMSMQDKQKLDTLEIPDYTEEFQTINQQISAIHDRLTALENPEPPPEEPIE